jgi:predicted nucleic acid-binding protein
VLRTTSVSRDKGQIEFGFGHIRKFDFGLFGRFLQALQRKHILAETKDLLIRRFKVPEETVTEIIALLEKQEMAPLPPTLPQIVIRDVNDLPVVAAAIEAKTEYLVSGDKDIPSLVPLREIRIVTPREFWGVISKICPR